MSPLWTVWATGANIFAPYVFMSRLPSSAFSVLRTLYSPQALISSAGAVFLGLLLVAMAISLALGGLNCPRNPR